MKNLLDLLKRMKPKREKRDLGYSGKELLGDWLSLFSRTHSFVTALFNWFGLAVFGYCLLVYGLAFDVHWLMWVAVGLLIFERLAIQWAYTMAVFGLRKIQTGLRAMGVM